MHCYPQPEKIIIVGRDSYDTFKHGAPLGVCLLRQCVSIMGRLIWVWKEAKQRSTLSVGPYVLVCAYKWYGRWNVVEEEPYFSYLNIITAQ